MSNTRRFFWLGFFLLLLSLPRDASADGSSSRSKREDEIPPVQLGDEYPEYAKNSPHGSSHKGSDDSFFVKALLYLPNRVLDLLDIFRVDVGAGPAYGAALRLTDYGQFGGRFMRPGSVRLGLFGRNSSVEVEEGDEYGIGPGFVRSRDRHVGHFEFGFSVDAFVGISVGFRLDEAADFVLGIFCIDIMDDDLT